MKVIPIYDATVPITCTADRTEIAERIELIERMHGNLTGIERTEHGIVLRFPDRPDISADVRRFAVDEKACCRFWGFEVTTDADEIALRWDAPPSLAGTMDRLFAHLSSDAPITAADGFL